LTPNKYHSQGRSLLREVERGNKCKFEKNGFCSALACYSNEKCRARDTGGNPKYERRNKCLPKKK